MTGAVTGVTGGSAGAKKSPSMQGLVDAARGGLVAFGTVYTGLEESAKVLGGKVKEESVDVVQHRSVGSCYSFICCFRVRLGERRPHPQHSSAFLGKATTPGVSLASWSLCVLKIHP